MSNSQQWSLRGLGDIFDLESLASSSIEQFLDLTLSKSLSWFGASGGSIFLKNDTDQFVLRATSGTQNSLPQNTVITRGSGVAGIVIDQGSPRIIKDLDGDEFSGLKQRQEIGSSMIIPLFNPKNEAIGVLNIARAFGETPFSEKDLDQAAALASYLALAVANAELFDELRSNMDQTRVANQKLIAVLDSIGGPVFVLDSQGVMIDRNHEARRLEDIFLRKESLLQEQIQELQIDLSERKSIKFHNSESGRFWIINAIPIESGGSVIALQDVTEHENKSKELARVQRLAEIGQMTATIAHEIRNPLTGIRSAAQMLKDSPELMEDFLPMIEDESIRLNELCENFLEFSRPMQLNLDSCDLLLVVERVEKLVRHDFEQKGVKLTVDASSNLPKILCDQSKVSQVLLNLVRNALDACESGSSVHIQIEDGILLVRDKGVGMTKEQQEKLFSPFYTTKSDGTGLGLCHSRKIVDAHGGELRVESEPGKGSIFTIDFRLVKEKAKAV